MKERIKLSDSTMDIISKMSEGDTEAVAVLMQMLAEGDKIDPQSWSGGLGAILCLDSHQIYGRRIWMLHKDVCEEDLTKTLAILRACNLGELRDIEMQHAIDFDGEGIDVDELVSIVKKQLPKFGLAV